MIIVDSSVMIDFLREVKNIGTRKLDEIISRGIPFGICESIYQELLQGTDSKKDFRKLKEYLDTLEFYSVKVGKESYAEAALIYLSCRKKGVTIRSTVDCLIAQIAIENNLQILHNDRDFINIKKVIKELEFY